MKVLEFAFEPDKDTGYLPHDYDKNCVVYTGTHDNDTIRSWYDTLPIPASFLFRIIWGLAMRRASIIRLLLAATGNGGCPLPHKKPHKERGKA